MHACASCEALEQLLGGRLPEEQAGGLYEHLAECAECRARLDRLSGVPELRRWLPPHWPPRPPAPEPGLAHVLATLRVTPCLDTPESGHTADALGAPLTFLAPPQSEGDLGALGPYRVLAELGRGGMGVVLLAYDAELQRPLALKVLLPHRAGAAARAQFVREARAAAGLAHDHVVPVHAVANPPDGPPYLVMPYVEGPTLRQRIQEEGRLDPREGARLCWQVAEGLAAAHQAGLVHRDIKPANVLLDRATGRARIVDFGLVRPAGPSGPAAPEGNVPGTPEYMSPEQVRQPDRADARSDVYSLGVTLYEALTGEVPFRGTPRLVLRQILGEEPVPPRRLNDRVGRDLETICLKALAKEPGRRYQTARELADDLRRWLQGEPIRARPVGPAGKLWRWARRQPALAGVTAALALAVAVGFAAVTSLWLIAERQRGLAEANAQQADEQRRRAERNARNARLAVHDHFILLSEAQLSRGRGTQGVRKELLEGALAHFQELLRQQPEDADLRADVADAHYRVGLITSKIGSKDKALAEFRKARALWEGLVGANPPDPAWQRGLADSCHHLGLLEHETGRPADALRSYRRARDLFAELLRGDAANRRYQRDLAAVHNDLGLIEHEAGRREQALRCYQQARDLRAALVRADGAEPRFRSDLARSHLNIGTLQAEAGRPAEALRGYQRARDLLEELVRANPTEPEFRRDLAASYNRLGLFQHEAGRWGEALRYHQLAWDLREKLVRDDPADTQLQRDLASSHLNLGRLYSERGKSAEARCSFKLACAVLEKLARDNPSATLFRSDLATSYQNLGILQATAGEPAEALRSYDKARALFEELVGANPDRLDYRSRLGGACNSVGNAQEALGRPEKAVAAYRQAVEQQRLAFAKAPQVTQYRLFLDRHYFDLARAQRRLGRPEEAAAALAECQKLWPKHAAKLYGVAREFALCASSVGEGEAELSATDQARRRRHADRALEALRQALAHGYKDVERLRTDPALDPLRPRADFKALLDELEKRAASVAD